jgi:fatty acid desaturase (delta-4 desaturase)
MCRNTDTLRNRLKNPSSSSTANAAELTPTNRPLKPTEISISGNIYDITNFIHPGGNVIQFFGGNDVTVQYKMIHPYHTEKHLEKMKLVGKVDYKSE